MNDRILFLLCAINQTKGSIYNEIQTEARSIKAILFCNDNVKNKENLGGFSFICATMESNKISSNCITSPLGVYLLQVIWIFGLLFHPKEFVK